MLPTDPIDMDADAIAEALNRVYDEVNEEPDPAILAASLRTLERAEWVDLEQPPAGPGSGGASHTQ
jgi:phytoene/squalene synthetase